MTCTRPELIINKIAHNDGSSYISPTIYKPSIEIRLKSVQETELKLKWQTESVARLSRRENRSDNVTQHMAIQFDQHYSSN